jgi:hypothetical protein
MAMHKARADGDPSLCKLEGCAAHHPVRMEMASSRFPCPNLPLNPLGLPIRLKQSVLPIYLNQLFRTFFSLAPLSTFITLMSTISGSTASSRFDAATRNQEAINADIVRQVLQAPSDLRQIFRTEGYDGVVRWSARSALLFRTPCSFL